MVIFTLFQELRLHCLSPIKGDAFALRSDYAMQIDFEEEAPAFRQPILTGLHMLLHPDVPTVHKPALKPSRKIGLKWALPHYSIRKEMTEN